MSPVLVNLAMGIGLIMGLLSLLLSVGRGVPVWPALFRAMIIVSVGSVVVMGFFRFFNIVLYRFLADKLKEYREQEKARRQQAEGVEK